MTAALASHSRIMIVDDERDNRELLEIILGREGYFLLSAASGEEALETLKDRQLPNLILLDIMMPDMDGYQVAAKIKGDALTRAIPILMVTALDAVVVRTRALGAGAEDVMTKPLDRMELCARVKSLLRPTI